MRLPFALLLRGIERLCPCLTLNQSGCMIASIIIRSVADVTFLTGGEYANLWTVMCGEVTAPPFMLDQ